MQLTALGITELAEGLKHKEFSSVDVTKAFLERIEQLNPKLNAYLTVATEQALAAAKAADERRTGGETGDLLGVPLAIKDNMTTVGIRTTAASKILEHYEPAYDATVIKKLKDAGAVILGKTNLDEFAHGASTENSAFGPTKNPWDTSRVPGGSSGGSAAAVAADLCIAALGSDTGGSIRHPSSFCGIVGLKTSYGRVSRSGLLSMTSSTDVIGPMTKTVRDAAAFLNVIAGPDPLDHTSYPKPVAPNEYHQALQERKDLKGLRFGVWKEFMGSGLTTGVASAINEAVSTMEQLGGSIVEVSLPYAKYSVPTYYIITPSEISSNLARYDGIRYGHRTSEASNLFEVYAKSRGEGLGPEAKRRIMMGAYVLSHGYYDAYYLQAQRVRTMMVREIEEALQSVDALLSPASPHVAFKLGSQTDDPIKMYLEDVYMSVASMAGLPALVVPAGFADPEDDKKASERSSREGEALSGFAGGGGDVSPSKKLPLGLQIIGRRFGEAALLAIGNVFEAATPWHKGRAAIE